MEQRCQPVHNDGVRSFSPLRLTSVDVHKTPLLAVFDSQQRLEVPLLKRQCVWDEDHQWLPLWEDIERKFTEALEPRENALVTPWGPWSLTRSRRRPVSSGRSSTGVRYKAAGGASRAARRLSVSMSTIVDGIAAPLFDGLPTSASRCL